MQGRLLLYFRKPKLTDRWFYGDRYLRSLIKLLFKKKKIGSLERVFINLCKGFDLLNVDYKKNLDFNKIKPDDSIVVLGTGKHVLAGYNQTNKIIAGIGLMTHPNDWPTLFKDYPIAIYLQHSEWTAAIYNKWYGLNSCKVWFVGIDTLYWLPKKTIKKDTLLIYIKFLWDKEENTEILLNPLLDFLNQRSINYKTITYGEYTIEAYKNLLENSKAMIFICEHESQGLAYQEAMAMNVPIFAWDQGRWLDRNLTTWGEIDQIDASSVPYFDNSCGEKFKDINEFRSKFDDFHSNVQAGFYHPRAYTLEHLSLEKSAERMLELIKEVYR